MMVNRQALTYTIHNPNGFGTDPMHQFEMKTIFPFAARALLKRYPNLIPCKCNGKCFFLLLCFSSFGFKTVSENELFGENALLTQQNNCYFIQRR